VIGLEQKVGKQGFEGLLAGMAQSASAIRSDMMHDRSCSSRLADNRDSRGVATEEMDILLHPFES
jgi:hypothetical protein